MKRFWFRFFLWLTIFASMLGFTFVASTAASVYAQTESTPTAGGIPQPSILNTYLDGVCSDGTLGVNVRAGPSSVYYGDPIGCLPQGATALALAITPGHDWIEISFPSVQNGVGWVYAPFVILTGAPPILEPPPTFTPIAISTVDPALIDTLSLQPTQTRLPTFTPSAPLTIPTFSVSPVEPSSHFPFGLVIIGLGIVGLLGIVVSIVGRQ